MTRYYYDDPLYAAIMARDFGVSYTKDGLVDGESIAVPHMYANADSFNNKYDLHIKDYKGRKYHIHPVNETIFEPIEGDKGYDSRGFHCEFAGGVWIQDITMRYGYYPVEITRRDDKSFFMPKRES